MGAVVVFGPHRPGGVRVIHLLHTQHHDRHATWHRQLADISEQGAIGADGEAALDAANISKLAPRWVHAMACEVGLSDLPELDRSVARP